jgi:hypothetical protein
LIAAPPAKKFSTICQVTSCGYAETPARGRAVIPRSDKNARLRDAWCQRVLDQADLQGQIFQSPERTQRFGLAIDFCLQGRSQRAVERGDAGIIQPRDWAEGISRRTGK